MNAGCLIVLADFGESVVQGVPLSHSHFPYFFDSVQVSRRKVFPKLLDSNVGSLFLEPKSWFVFGEPQWECGSSYLLMANGWEDTALGCCLQDTRSKLVELSATQRPLVLRPFPLFAGLPHCRRLPNVCQPRPRGPGHGVHPQPGGAAGLPGGGPGEVRPAGKGLPRAPQPVRRGMADRPLTRHRAPEDFFFEEMSSIDFGAFWFGWPE